MQPSDFVFEQVYRQSIKLGASERCSKDMAIEAVADYKKGKFKKIAELVQSKIKEAVKKTRAQK